MRFRNLISDLANDCIVILSSHIVSDIDTIADKVAIMKNGTLITHGDQEDIIQNVKEKVFETTFEKYDLAAFKTQQIVVSTYRKNNQLVVRYIANSPVENSIKKTANLEDAYLYLTKTN